MDFPTPTPFKRLTSFNSSFRSSNSSYEHHSNLDQMYYRFKPMLISLKIFGLLPLTFHPGGEKTPTTTNEDPPQIFRRSWISPISIFSLLIFGLYIAETVVFGPYMFYIAKERNPMNDKLALTLETTFFTIQLWAAICTYIFVQHKATAIAGGLNQLSIHVAYFVAHDPQFGRRCFRMTNILLVFWFTLLVMIVSFMLVFKSTEMSQYFTFSEHSKLIIQPILFVCYLQTASHFIPAYFYARQCELIGDCFVALGTIAVAVSNKSKAGPGGERWLDLYGRYQYMNALCDKLSNIFGVYFIVQLITLILTSVVHMYFVAFPHSGYHPGYLYAIPLSVCFGYVGWMATVGNYGNSYKEKVETCSDELIKAASADLDCARDPRIFGPLMRLTSSPKGLHFSNYVTADRGLPTMVLSVLATYFVILVQFNGAVENTLKS